MALPSQIERAARGDRRPTSPKETIPRAEALLSQPDLPPEVLAEYRRKAARKLADIAAALHPCELDPGNGIEVCTHEHHQRDADLLRLALEALDALEGDAPPQHVTVAAPPAPAVTAPAIDLRDMSWQWQQHAACAGEDVNLFFGFDRENAREKGTREAKAKAICFGCPVRVECLEFALDNGEQYGIWGGLTEDERVLLRRRSTRRRRRWKARVA